MSVDGADSTPLKGVYETYGGLRDFERFDDYLMNWIRPNVLPDVETVLEGARERWDREQHLPGAAGRGDFFMATVVLSLMDHLGSFLVESSHHWITAAENIARVAMQLDSTFDVFAVLANLGRNALIHGAWPQTEVKMETRLADSGRIQPWGFGLSFNANSNPERHDTLHNRRWGHEYTRTTMEPRTIKLVLNVHNLRAEIVKAIDSSALFRHVTDQGFERVRNASRVMGDPWRTNELNDLLTPGYQSKQWRMARPKVFDRRTFTNQITELLPEAIEIGAWDGKPDEKFKRTHRGKHPR